MQITNSSTNSAIVNISRVRELNSDTIYKVLTGCYKDKFIVKPSGSNRLVYIGTSFISALNEDDLPDACRSFERMPNGFQITLTQS